MFFFLLPFRAKNPPEQMPWGTIALMALNILFYLFSADFTSFLWRTKDGYIQDFAISDEHFTVIRIFTSMFLHGDITHIAGNMVFLWVFGASVEGRLKTGKYLALYFLCGIGGTLCSEAFDGIAHSTQYSLGASGAIFGVAAAYLWIFPYSTIRVFWLVWLFIRVRFGVFEAYARWVVGFFIAQNLLLGVVFHSQDGVGHFAHLGGCGVGLLMCLALKPRRDDEQTSNVQALRSDLKDISMLATNELERLLEAPTENIDMILTYCEKCIAEPGQGYVLKCLKMMTRYQSMLIDKGDPNRLAHILLHIPRTEGAMQSVFYLKLGSKLEGAAQHEPACRIYRRIYDLNPHSLDAEVALYRIGRIMEKVYQDQTQAIAAYTEMLRLFPSGRMALDGQRALQGLGQGAPVLPVELRGAIRSSSGTPPTAQPRVPRIDQDAQPAREAPEPTVRRRASEPSLPPPLP